MKNLVIVPFGNNSIESNWIFNEKDRDFDVILLFYHQQILNPKLKESSNSFKLFHLMDFKWVMISHLLAEKQIDLTPYDYFFFPDDDIEIEQSTIRQLFHFMQTYSLEMTQPVLSRGSFKSWKVLKQKYVSGIRYLSAVELMCPALSKGAMEELHHTFCLNQSGWGIDILWGELIRKKFGDKSIAVCDLLTAKHTKPVGKGELYSKLGKTAFEERDEIFEKYKITKQKIFALPINENRFFNRIRSYFKLKDQLKEA